MLRLIAFLALTQVVGNDGLDGVIRGRNAAASPTAFRTTTLCASPVASGVASPVADTGQAITWSRASAESCFTGSGNSMVQLANNVLCVEPATSAMGIAGCGSWPGTTNRALWSNDQSNAAWSQTSITVVGDNAVFVDGSTTMAELTGTASNAWVSRTVGGYSSTTGPINASAWESAVSGSGPASVFTQCAGSVSSCACLSSNSGVSCTASVQVGVLCEATATVTTTPTRLSAIATCSSASASTAIYIPPGSYGASNGASDNSGGAQFETLSFTTPLVPTTTTSVQRQPDTGTAASSEMGIMGASGSAGCFHWTVTPAFGATTAGTDRPLFNDGAGDVVYLRAGTSKLEATFGGATADTLALSFNPYTQHDWYVRFTVGGNVCVKADSAAEVCTAGVTAFTPSTNSYWMSDSSGGFGGWWTVGTFRAAAYAPGSCT